MEFRLQTLSPVHIGTGREFEPFEYVVEGRKYYRVNLDAFVEKAYELDPAAPEKLAVWIAKTVEEIEALEAQKKAAGRGGGRDYNQQLMERRRNFNLITFSREHQEFKDIAQALLTGNELVHYSCMTNVGDERNKIREAVKAAGFQSYIPGSSVKGAIRTALAHLILTEMGEKEKRHILDGIPGTDIRGLSAFIQQVKGTRDPRGKAKLKEDAGTDVEKVIFRCGVRRKDAISYEDVHFDLMRVISISDTYAPQARLLVSQIYTFLKKRLRDGNTRLGTGVMVLLEALADNSEFSIRVEVDAAFIKRVARIPPGKEWIGLPEKFKRLLGFVLDEAASMSCEEIEQKVLTRIKEACCKHAKAVVGHEGKWLQGFQPNEAVRIREFYQKFSALPEHMTPLRVGWGSHFMTTTLLLAFRNDSVLGTVLKELIKVFELDLIPSQKKLIQDLEGRQINVDEFPRSRRLISVNGQPAAPFGWVALRMPGADPAPKLLDMEALMKEQPAPSPSPRQPSSHRSHGSAPGGRRPPPRQEIPRRPEPPVKMPALPKPPPRPEPQATGKPKVKKGDKISAEVLSNEGGVVRVRLTGASGEEISFWQIAYPHQAEGKVKVKVEKVDTTGKITKVLPA